MAFCSQCGTQIPEDSRFCPNCGASTGGPVPPVNDTAEEQSGPQDQQQGQGGPQYRPYQGSQYQQPYREPERTYVPDGDARALGVGGVSAFAYSGILFFIPLTAYRDSRFARFHAGQGLNLLLAEVVYGIAVSILKALFYAISFGLGTAFSALFSIASIAFAVFAVMGIVNVCKGEMKPLPLVGGFQIIKM